MQNPTPTLWAEDLEGHRQPSLYYICDEDNHEVEGPTLICDWNGAPTNYEDFEFDLMSTGTKTEIIDKAEPQSEHDKLIETSDEYDDYSNPAADLIKPTYDSGLPNQTSVINDYDLGDCRHLDFLSVPPMTQGLLKYVLKHFKQMSQQKPIELKQEHIIKQEPSNSLSASKK